MGFFCLFCFCPHTRISSASFPLRSEKTHANSRPSPLAMTPGQRRRQSPEFGPRLIFLLDLNCGSQLHLHLCPFSSPMGLLIQSAITDARLDCERGHILCLLPIWRAPERFPSPRIVSHLWLIKAVFLLSYNFCKFGTESGKFFFFFLF